MVAVGVFLVVSGVSFTLFSRHQALLAKGQALSGLNTGLRSALAQIQTDLINGGAGMIMGPSLPNAPIGVAIFNNTGTSCQDTTNFTYADTCFDKLWVVLPDSTFPLMHPTAVFDTSSGGSITVTPQSSSTSTIPVGTQVIFLKNSTSGAHFTTALLSAATTFNGVNTVTLNYTTTQSGGTNGSTSNDPTGMTVNVGSSEVANVLTDDFDTPDWIIAIAPVEYYVDATNTADPRLMRQRGNAASDLVLDQVIGFKVGATYSGSSDAALYHYALADYGPDFSLIRSVRVTLLTRTVPNTSLGFTNPFDGGPYQVIGSSVVVNPRNLSAVDN